MDQYGKPNPEVLYLLPGGDVSMHLRRDGLAYQLRKTEGPRPDVATIFEPKPGTEAQKVSHHVVELEWLGSDVQSILPGRHSGMVYNYFTSTALGITGVKSYSTVHYQGLYEGVDLIYSITPEGNPKYDLVLEPGADLSAVRFRVKGASSLRLDEHGLHMATSISPLLETIPASFILHPGGGKEPVQVHYVALGDDTFGFASEVAIPNDAGLLIDPCSYTVRWASFYGEDESEVILDMAVTPYDEVVFAGMCSNLGGNSTVIGTGVFQGVFTMGSTTPPQYDAFIGKLSSDGSTGYWTYFGGDSIDIASGVDIHHSTGNIYVCGTTNSPDLESNVTGAGGAVPTNYGYHALTDGFIAAFSPDLDVVYWTSFFGSEEGDNLVDIKVDNYTNDYLAVIGRVDVPLDPTYFPSVPLNCHDSAAVAAVFSLSAGTCDWLEGLALQPVQLDIDSLGQYIAVAGSVNSDPSGCTTYALHGSTYSNGVDAAVEVLDFYTGASISLALLTGSSSADDDFATDVHWMDDHVVVCGYTWSSDFPILNPWQGTFGGGNTDGFAAYFENYDLSSSGNDWVTYIGDGGDDAATDLWCIPDVINGNTGVIWVGGLTDPAATLPYDCSVPSTTSNGFLLILDETGAYQESLDPGLVPHRVEVNSQQQIVLGAWDPGNLAGTAFQPTTGGNGDVFIAVLEGTGIYAMPILGGNGSAFDPVLAQNAQRTRENELVVWPNPSHGGVLNLSLYLPDAGDARVSVELYDATGRLVLQHAQQGEGPGRNNFQLVPTGLSSGLYTLRVSAGSHEHRCTWAVE